MEMRTQPGLVMAMAVCGLCVAHAGEMKLAHGEHLAVRTAVVIKAKSAMMQKEGKIGENRKLNQERIDACGVLGKLRAQECIPDLIKVIDKLHDWSSPRLEMPPVEVLFPVVSALIQIGKPASLACVDEIAKTDWAAAAKTPDTDISQPQRHRVSLLTLVVTGVETPKVAEFMLKKRVEKAAESEKKPLLYALSLVQKQLKNHR